MRNILGKCNSFRSFCNCRVPPIVLVAAALLFVVVTPAIICTTTAFRRATEAAVYSTAASVYASLDKSIPELDERFMVTDEQWHVLSDAQYDAIIAAMYKNAGGFDRKGWEPGTPLQDDWGRRLRIAFKRSPDGRLQFIVWSVGRDGVSGTDDDIVYPLETKLPSDAAFHE